MSCCLWDQRLDWNLHPYQYAVTVHENRYVTYLPLSSSTYLYHPLSTLLPTSIILYLPLSSSTYSTTYLYHPLPTTSILVYAVLSSSINYDIIVTVYKNASRDVCRLELHHVDASIHLSPREIDELYHCTQVLCSRHSQLHMVRYYTLYHTNSHNLSLIFIQQRQS